MLKAKELREFDKWTYFIDEEHPRLTLEFCKEQIEKGAKMLDLDCVVEHEEIKVGGVFNKEVENCLIIYHPHHIKDYWKFCFRLKNQGIIQLVQIDDFGRSKQFEKENIENANRELRNDQWKYSNSGLGEKITFNVANKIATSIKTLGRNKTKYEREKEYYGLLIDILSQFNNSKD